ncbi:MAG: hypothetical protein PWP04_1504 [Candidatus Atribacteria bacterium]|nr:hypothetical protein [Candidatus Atribacteria bacterium]
MRELPLKCKSCKAVITMEDVTEIGIYKIPAYRELAYIRYICPYCRDFGEATFSLEKIGDVAKISRSKKKSKAKGQITIDEIIEFHKDLEKLKNANFLKFDREE